MNEINILKSVLPLLKQGKDIIVGPGDDCAVINVGLPDKLMLIAADQVVLDVHYTSKTIAKDIANKLLNRNISDIAAMGGFPAYAILTISTNISNESWFKEFFTAISETAKIYNISICGGDISSNPRNTTVCSLTITGWVKKNNLCLRSNAKKNDCLFATGKFGNSFSSERHLYFQPRLKEAVFIAGKYSNTMIDTSDGLLLDAARIADASDLSLTLWTNKIPCCENTLLKNALSDGEDYELLFALSSDKAEKLKQDWNFNVKLTEIGIFTEKKLNSVYDTKGNNLINNKIGFKHFNE